MDTNWNWFSAGLSKDPDSEFLLAEDVPRLKVSQINSGNINRIVNKHGLVMLWKSGKEFDGMLFRVGHKYNVKECYESAQKRRDPLRAPHGFLRALNPKDIKHALAFFYKFGPLIYPSIPDEIASQISGQSRFDLAYVDLADFFYRRELFTLVSELWEKQHDAESLKATWNSLAELQARIIRPAIPKNTQHTKKEKYTLEEWMDDQGWTEEDLFLIGELQFKLPWAREFCSQDEWLRQKDMIPKSVEWIEGYVANRLRSSGSSVWDLWDMIWAFFKMDFEKRLFWRRCLECETFFYPRRKDSKCCTSKHQSIWSKREYWRRTHLKN